MKKILLIFLILYVVVVLNSCSDSDARMPDYAYYFAVDKADDGANVLYTVMTDGSDKSHEKERNFFIKKYNGQNVKAVFSDFFNDSKNVYTGTVKEYAVGKDMGEDGLTDFKLYLTNSPKLPAKRKTVVVENSEAYINDKMAEKNGTEETDEKN